MHTEGRTLFAMVLSAMIAPTATVGSAETPPLPPKMAQAKTAYLISRTGVDAHREAAYEALKKWGKWEIVSDSEMADLIILINRSATGLFSTGNTVPAATKTYYLHVLDPKNGDALWTTKTNAGRNPAADARKLVENLKRRMN